MKDKGNIYIHFIMENDDKVLIKHLASSVPRAGDEIRIGGEDNDRYYKVTRVVWVYDEPDFPYERVNIGIV